MPLSRQIFLSESPSLICRSTSAAIWGMYRVSGTSTSSSLLLPPRARIARQQRTSANLHIAIVSLSFRGSFISVDEKRRLPARTRQS